MLSYLCLLFHISVLCMFTIHIIMDLSAALKSLIDKKKQNQLGGQLQGLFSVTTDGDIGCKTLCYQFVNVLCPENFNY